MAAAFKWLKDTTGKVLHPPDYDYLQSFENGLEGFVDNPREFNLNGDPPLHALVRIRVQESAKGKKQRLMVKLLQKINLYVNWRNRQGATALHVATQLGDVESVKALLVFEADAHALNKQNKTPLDLLQDRPDRHEGGLKRQGSRDLESVVMSDVVSNTGTNTAEIKQLLALYGGECSHKMKEFRGSVKLKFRRQSKFFEIPEKTKIVDPNEYIDLLAKHFYTCESNIHGLVADISDNTGSSQAQNGLRLAEEVKKMFTLKAGGSRVLALDGGGMGCLVQVEVLMELERQTGMRISELFDWFIGTSSGSYISAGVLTGRSLLEIKSAFFRSLEEWFSQGLVGPKLKTDIMEVDFKELVGEQPMNAIKFPNHLVTAVDKSMIPLSLRIFNNCFGDEFSTQPIWKVCMYSSAAPMVSKEQDDYLDGGVLANNPSECGLTRIQSYYRQRNERLPMSVVVSIGTGLSPPENVGSTDVFDFNLSTYIGERVKNLAAVLLNGIGQTANSALNTQSRCEDQHVPYYRFNVKLDTKIQLYESDYTKLVGMLVDARRCIVMSSDFSDLVQQLQKYPAAKQRALEILKPAD